jgi:hypothetical protein
MTAEAGDPRVQLDRRLAGPAELPAMAVDGDLAHRAHVRDEAGQVVETAPHRERLGDRQGHIEPLVHDDGRQASRAAPRANDAGRASFRLGGPTGTGVMPSRRAMWACWSITASPC